MGITFETVAVRFEDTDHNAPAVLLPPRSDRLKMLKNPPFWLDTVITTLSENDFCVVPAAFPTDFCAALRADLLVTPLRPAAVGRGDGRQHAPTIRNDSTSWLDGSSAVQRAYLAAMATLQDSLNRHFYLGLNDYEAHYALYPAGGFYQRHLDSFRGNNARRVTTVCYLNEDWQAEDGGELALYRGQTDREGLCVQPEAGTLVVFLSENIPHEVRPSQRERMSIAGWYRIRT